MAFRFGDPGGRGYNAVGTSNANQLAWWTGPNTGVSFFTITSSGGRILGNSLHIATANGRISRSFDNQSTWGIAFALKLSTITVANQIIFALYDSVTTQCEIRINLDGTISVTRNGTVLGTTVIAVIFNVWTHIEWKTVINNSTGTTEVRINGVTALTLTSQDTQNTGNATASVISLGSTVGSGTFVFDIDDIIIWDGQTTDAAGNSDIHDFIGDCGLNWGLPTGAGNSTQFTASPTTTNYARVNEATPDGDTTYVEDSTVGHIDTYAMADLPASAATVKSMAVVNYARKTDVGARGMKAEIRTNSANFAYATEIALGNSYAYYFSNWGFNPSGTPAAWTVADINAIESGQQVSS